jgi:hypothetical protein
LLIEAIKILETAQALSFKKITEEEIKGSGDRATVETNILIGLGLFLFSGSRIPKARQK